MNILEPKLEGLKMNPARKFWDFLEKEFYDFD
jgi:hypothetical protein